MLTPMLTLIERRTRRLAAALPCSPVNASINAVWPCACAAWECPARLCPSDIPTSLFNSAARIYAPGFPLCSTRRVYLLPNAILSSTTVPHRLTESASCRFHRKFIMSRISDILTLARTRAEQQGFNYSGDVTPLEAYTLCKKPGTVLVGCPHTRRVGLGRSCAAGC